MSRLMVMTTPELAPGYQLAGVETFAIRDGADAAATLRELMDGNEASLIAVRQSLLAEIDHHLQRRIESSYRPIVVAIPDGVAAAATERRRYITELIRRAIGFRITFGGEEAEE